MINVTVVMLVPLYHVQFITKQMVGTPKRIFVLASQAHCIHCLKFFNSWINPRRASFSISISRVSRPGGTFTFVLHISSIISRFSSYVNNITRASMCDKSSALIVHFPMSNKVLFFCICSSIFYILDARW